MKKFFFLSLSLMLSVCGFAQTFHSPGAKHAGTPYEYLNLSNTLTNAAVKDGVANKYGINESYPWIVYSNSGSLLDNGQGEVSRGGYWVSYNPVFFNPEFFYMVDDASLYLGSPKVEVGWVKGETYFDRLVSKHITFNVENTTRVDFLLTGAGSNTNVADVFVLDAADNSVVQTITTEEMPGKSNKAAEANTKSDTVYVKGLDAAKKYLIVVAPSASATQLEVAGVDEDGDPVKVYKPFAEVCGDANLFDDVDVAGKNVSNVKAPAVAVAALHIYGTDLEVAPRVAKAPADEFYSPAGNEMEDAKFAYINLEDAVRNNASLTSFDAEGNPSSVNKYAVKDEYPWIYYNYTGSVLDNGLMELARGGYYFSMNPITGAEEIYYSGTEAAGWTGSPKIEVGYAKGNTYINKLMPKTIQFNIKEATKVDFLLTGAGSNTNVADVKVLNAADKSVVKTITTEQMPGKSNKNNGSASASLFVAIDELDPDLTYTVVIAPCVSATQLEVAGVDEEGDPAKVYKPIAEVLGEGVDFCADVTVDEALCVSNIKSPAVAVSSLRVWSQGNCLEEIIAAAKTAGKNTVNLNNKVKYELNAAAEVDPTTVLTINGNGATIKVGAEGQFVAQKGIVLDNVVVDATDATKNLIELEADAAKVDASLFTFVDGVSKYEGGSQNMPEAEKVVLKNSIFKNIPQGLISGNTQKWAIDELTIDNSIVNFNTTSINSGNANQSAFAFGSVKELTINESTIYNVVENTGSYMFRTSNASNAGKVWGSNPKDTHVFAITNSTFVNALGKKDFANAWYSNGNFTVVLDNNVFYDVFRVKNKFVGNCSFDKENTPSKNIFDHSEGYSLAGDENAIATVLENAGTSGILLPTEETGFEMATMGAYFGLYDAYKTFGDPRWAEYSKGDIPTVIESVATATSSEKVRKAIVNGKLVIVKNGNVYNVAGQVVK